MKSHSTLAELAASKSVSWKLFSVFCLLSSFAKELLQCCSTAR